LKPALVATAASEEWAGATRWYEARRPGLGAEFHDAVVAAIARIETHPDIGALSTRRPLTRELTLTRFPYKLVYRVRSEYLYVVAVAHAKRRPGYWRQRP
jgi:plasmid stabilization system protein ParE